MKLLYKFANLLIVLTIFAAGEADGQVGNADFFLKNNDRVVFYGDSITEQGFYTNFVETYVVTRFPRMNVGFVNAGWSGDKIWGGDGGTLDERLKRDVYLHRPTVVTAMLGMNDGCYIEFDAGCFKVYGEFYEKFIGALKINAPNARITLLEPSPFDDWTDSHAWRLPPPIKGGYNDVLIRYGQFVREVAQKNRLTSADLNAPLVEVIKEAQKTDRELAQKIIPDRIHPGAAGGLLMAAALLKSWNAPGLVSAVEIDAAGVQTMRAENAKITALRTDREISWTQLDEALPLPLGTNDQTTALVLRLTGIGDHLNRQMLTVKNLSAPHYALQIDGAEIGVLNKEELAQGVNLASFQTPMLKQSFAVHVLTEQHNKVHFARWREMQVPFGQENLIALPKILRDLDSLEAELVKRQRAAAQPKTHQFKLMPRA